MRGNESARDIDALLLAAGERRRRQVPQSLGQIELAQQLAGPDKRLSPLDASLHQRFSNDIVCADARNDAQAGGVAVGDLSRKDESFVLARTGRGEGEQAARLARASFDKGGLPPLGGNGGSPHSLI